MSSTTELAYNVVGRGGVGLIEDGFLVGIEKYRLRNCDPSSCYKHWFRDANPADDKFAKVTKGTKTMVVTHLAQYKRDTSGAKSHTLEQILYNPYAVHEGYPRFASRRHDFFGDGMAALESLEQGLIEALDRGAAAGRAYSHIIVLSMGWNNDQLESIGRYNRILANMRATAPSQSTGYRPLVVAISWPSVWFSGTDSVLKRWFGHVASYPNKTNDADELGYTLASWILHRSVARAVTDQPRTRQPVTVAIGHSFGARMLSRALFASEYIDPGRSTSPAAGGELDVFIGLQGAFSANRFIYGEGEESSPYAGFQGKRTAVVLTSANSDKPNALARFLTGARHVGGRFGLEAANNNSSTFCLLSWPWLDPSTGDGARPPPLCLNHAYGNNNRDKKRVLVVDVGSILLDGGSCQPGSSLKLGWEESDRITAPSDACASAHNDILDEQMAKFIWAAISTGPKSRVN